MDFPRTRVAIFCGGRGSATILRSLCRRLGDAAGEVELSLLINAYDDGRSTGMLRALIPGMPGPADFRKNLALLLGAAGRKPRTSWVLEHRLAAGSTRADVEALLAGAGADPDHRDALEAYTAAFFAYVARRGVALDLDLDDCAVGNLILSGAYLHHDRDFNRAIAELGRALGAPARLVNVDRGEARVLVGLKEDGELLDCEAAIVGAQSEARIADLFFLPTPLDAEARAALEGRSVAEKRATLSALHRDATISAEAAAALREADLVVYGPGTQFSSLLPSYAVRGVPEAIDAGAAKARVFFVNLREDHDIRGLSATDLVDRALRFLGDPSNRRARITHVLADRATDARASGVRAVRARDASGAPEAWELESAYRHARWIDADLEDAEMPGVHAGERAAELLLALHAGLREAPSAAVAGAG